MQRDSWVQLAAAVVLAVSLVASGVLATGLAGEAGRHKLTYTQRVEQNDPPQVSLGIAMGAFRGLFVNWLWMRANTLKEAGRYHEAIDLASTITKLQPRFPHVWAFHAWNMSYNISVATNTFPERWQWVQAGIRLLRDEGIPANPSDLLLHKELAYLFLHKIQGWMDDANQFYKRQHALEWTMVLGEPPRPDPLSRDHDAATRKFVDWLRPIVDAPDSPIELASREPKAREIVDRLRDLEIKIGILELHAVMSAVARSGQRTAIEKTMGSNDLEVLKLVEDPEMAAGWRALLAYLRRRTLIDKYHMEPDRMLRYTERWGPLDWRHPAAHGLYWAARGVEKALTRVTDSNKKDFDFVNTDRMVAQALQELWRSGEIYFDFLGAVMVKDITNPFYEVAPNIHFTDSYGNTIAELRDRSRFDEKTDAYGVYSAGYENFLIEATRFYYRRGQYDLAQMYYDRAANDPRYNLNTADRPIRFSKPLAEFIKDETGDEYTRPDVAREEVIGSLHGAYLQGLLGGDDELFQRQFEFAKQVHRWFMEKQGRVTSMDPDVGRMEVMSSDFRLVAANQLVQLIQFLDLDDAETLYNNAPEGLRRYAYDRIRENFGPLIADLEKRGGRSVGQMFPEPSGMEEHREEMQRIIAAEVARRPKLESK